MRKFGIVGRERSKLALAVCVQVKNSIMTRSGLIPEQAVLGRSLRWFESENRDDGTSCLRPWAQMMKPGQQLRSGRRPQFR